MPPHIIAIVVVTAIVVLAMLWPLFRPTPKAPSPSPRAPEPTPSPPREDASPPRDLLRERATRDVLTTTMAIGTEAVKVMMKERHPDAERLDVDWAEVWQDGETFVVVDPCAGDAVIGYQSGEGANYAQGTRAYLRTCIERTPDEALREALRDALDRDAVRYLHLVVRIREQDGTSKVDGFTVAEFRMGAS